MLFHHIAHSLVLYVWVFFPRKESGIIFSGFLSVLFWLGFVLNYLNITCRKRTFTHGLLHQSKVQGYSHSNIVLRSHRARKSNKIFLSLLWERIWKKNPVICNLAFSDTWRWIQVLALGVKTFVYLIILKNWERTSKVHYCLFWCPLGKWREGAPTKTIEQRPAGGLRSHDKVRKPTDLGQKERKSLWLQLKKWSWCLTKLTLKVPKKIWGRLWLFL